ncbi:ABC transporter ATP-binding protein [Gemmata sp. G18]|uniref:ABC transporter ATP-binding protein n=1 Tax=Gemmata palustris TaxID=2822762 RepID=A0ABS5C121_9BACT|nr:ABC transporter ATP-binding protein [Gemmata palustris]MBP3959680.1 ABC transporter ATP-binding protein [Gemmata palustris]
MPLPVALSLVDVTVRYGARTAIERVSLDVRRGEIVGLLGPNGSGKSTTLAVAAGVLDPVCGTVTAEGCSRATNPAAFAQYIGLVPQEPAVYDELTAVANLTFFGQLYGLVGHDLRRRVTRALARVKLTDRAQSRVSTFSGGMKQRLNLAAALLHDPPVLLLDEPTASLDPASRDALFADLTRFRDDGHAILLTTHHMDEAEAGCDRIAVLEGGRLVANGPPAELLHTRRTDRAVLYGHLRTRPPKYLERAIRQRLSASAELEITGRRLRLSANTSEQLGETLATLLAEGIELESFRTPAGALERALRSDECGTGERA